MKALLSGLHEMSSNGRIDFGTSRLRAQAHSSSHQRHFSSSTVPSSTISSKSTAQPIAENFIVKCGKCISVFYFALILFQVYLYYQLHNQHSYVTSTVARSDLIHRVSSKLDSRTVDISIHANQYQQKIPSVNFQHKNQSDSRNSKNDVNAHMMTVPLQQLTSKAQVSRVVQSRNPPPKSLPPRKETLLPKNVITIFGPESSGTTFLSTALAVATGAFQENGTWIFHPGVSWIFPENQEVAIVQPKWQLDHAVGRRIMTADGQWEIQHLSLPWGWLCQENVTLEVVEALVPGECFRYEMDPHLPPKRTEEAWYSVNRRETPSNMKNKKESPTLNLTKRSLSMFRPTEETKVIPKMSPEDQRLINMCREEVHITEKNDIYGGPWTCGAKCGTGAYYDGYALYPKRFSVNITSHIEWYLARGVQITAVLSVRDRTVTAKAKGQDHCGIERVGKEENLLASQLMIEALRKYGKKGSANKSDGKERAIVVSYEGLMDMQEAYLLDIYQQLGINSTYVPKFIDGNRKYIAPLSIIQHRINKQNQDKKNEEKTDEQRSKPTMYHPPLLKANLLPKKVIAIFGAVSSGTEFLSYVLSVATGAFPSEGKWVQILTPDPQLPIEPISPKKKWLFMDSPTTRAVSPEGEWEVQHLTLPSTWRCNEASQMEGLNIVEAFVPEECFRYESLPDLDPTLAEQIWDNMHDFQALNKIESQKKDFENMVVDDYNWEVDFRYRKKLNTIFAEQCRNEVQISNRNNDIDSSWSCGAKCGQEEFDGFALYPNRYFVNITSHIEWYLSRGVDITVLISMRDRSISSRSKHTDHCSSQSIAEEEELAMSLMKEALERYGTNGAGKNGGRVRVSPISYEALMELKEDYLFDLYHQLGVNSTFIPKFQDGNEQFVIDAPKINRTLNRPKKLPPIPKDWKPRPPKESILPKRVITVFGPESSGTTFLATTLGIATGAFNADGEWYQNLSYETDKKAIEGALLTPKKVMDFKRTIDRRVSTLDEVLEIQHLSLPWGWLCESNTTINIVDALVPDECFRYEHAPDMGVHLAESFFWREYVKKKRKQPPLKNLHNLRRGLQEYSPIDLDLNFVKKCQEEVNISTDSNYTCGATCGKGSYNGFALYPQRFFVNITSHIEWYLSRGVDITVILSMRDRSISESGKFHGHCKIKETCEEEDNLALSLMKEALEKYGKYGSRRGTFPADADGKERVIAVPYEVLMGMNQAYLSDLYKQLGINSTYTPNFEDGNAKYVTAASLTNLNTKQLELRQHQQQMKESLRPPKPAFSYPVQDNEFALPKRLITVFSLDLSRIFSTAVAVAVGAFPKEGRWIQNPNAQINIHNEKDLYSPSLIDDWLYQDTVSIPVRTSDGEIEVQHVLLPTGLPCTQYQDINANIVDALIPLECTSVNISGKLEPPERVMAEKCQKEFHISEKNIPGVAPWTCGAECGKGDYNGYAIYPQRFFVNISAHIEWYMSRGVDVTVVLQLRDHSITKKQMMGNCNMTKVMDEEYLLGMNLIKEAYKMYGTNGTMLKNSDGGKERAFIVSYEGLMELKEVYLFEMYQHLGIKSLHTPIFFDENAEYVSIPHSNDRRRNGIFQEQKRGHL